jgi:hypothetical protein
MFIKRFKNKEQTLEYLEKNPTFILVSYNEVNTIYKYIVCSDLQTYYNLINKINVMELIEDEDTPPILKPFTTHTNNIFEVITKTDPKIYIDLDFRPTPKTKTHFNNIINTIKINLSRLLNIDLTSELLEFLIYTRQEDKADIVLSSHIIFYKLNMIKEDQKKLMTELKTINILQDIDISIYTKDRNFCFPNHTKFNYNNKRFFIPYNEYTKDNNKIELFLLNDTNNCKLVIFDNAQEKKTIKKEIETKNYNITNINTTHNNFIELLIAHLPLEFYTSNNFIFKSLVKYLINNNYDVETFLNHSKTQEQKEYTQEETEEYIELITNTNDYYKNILLYITNKYNLRFYIESKLTDQFIEYVKHITNEDLRTQLIMLDTEAREDNYELKKDKLNLTYKHFTINYREHLIKDNLKNTFYYEPQDTAETNSTYKILCDDKINNIEDLKNHIKTTKTNSKLIFVKALYGSGKTKQIIITKIEMFFKQNPNKKILFITENNTLNSELQAKLSNHFKHLTIKYHQEYNEFNKKKKDYEFMEEFKNIDIYICSLESINTRTTALIKYDLIILDEYSSILTHFKSPTMIKQDIKFTKLIDNEYTKFKKFKSLLLEANEIIALDADLTKENTEFLECLLDVKADKFYCNDNRFNDYTIYNYYSNSHLLNKVNETLTQNKKIALCSTSKRQLNAIYTTHKNKNNKTILLLDRDGVKLYKNSHEETINKDTFLKNIEHYIVENQVELFLYSPTITTGISIEIAYFNILFAFCFNRFSPTARTFTQMLFRNRNLIDKEIYISYIKGLNFNPNINKNTIDEKYKLSKNYDMIFNSTHTTEKQDKDFKTLDILNEIELKYSILAYTQELLTLLKQHNLRVVNIYSNKKYSDDGIEIEDAKILNDVDRLEALGRANTITKQKLEEYKLKQELGTLTLTEKYEVDRYNLIKTNDPIKTDLLDRLTKILATDTAEIIDNKIRQLRGLTITKNLLKQQYKYYYYDYNTHINLDTTTTTYKQKIEEYKKSNKKIRHTNATTSEDRQQTQNNILHSILNILGLNRNNNFNITYTNEDFNKHINNHKETIINNFDNYIDLLDFKHLYFNNAKNITDTIKKLISQLDIIELSYSSKKYSNKSLADHPNHKYDKDTSINIKLCKNIYCFYNPYNNIPNTDAIKILQLKNNNYKAISIINNIYNEITFNNIVKTKEIYITNSNKWNMNAEQAKKAKEAKEKDHTQKRLKQYNNRILAENTIIKFEPIEDDYNVNTNIILRMNEDGLLKSFVKIDIEKLYKKQEPLTYYTTQKQQKIITNANVDVNNITLNKLINSYDGIHITRKTDINKIYIEQQPIYRYGFNSDKIRLNNNFEYEDITRRIKYNIKFLTRTFNNIRKQTRQNRFNRLKEKIENTIYNIDHYELESDDEYI